MIKKQITYTDFNGESVTDDFHFHLSKAELIQWEMESQGGLEQHLAKIAASNDGKTVYGELKSIILKAYGKRSEDGKGFVKRPQDREVFETSEAFGELIMELLSDADGAAAFMQGLMPANLDADMNRAMRRQAAKGKGAGGFQEKRTPSVHAPDADALAQSPDAPATGQDEDAGLAPIVDKPEPIKLSAQDVLELDADEVRSGIATGKYTLI